MVNYNVETLVGIVSEEGLEGIWLSSARGMDFDLLVCLVVVQSDLARSLTRSVIAEAVPIELG